MKNLTEIAEVLDRGGAVTNGPVAIQLGPMGGLCISGVSVAGRADDWQPYGAQRFPFNDPAAWSEYHEPKPAPVEPTVEELKALIIKMRGVIDDPFGTLFIGWEAKLRMGPIGEALNECDRLGIKPAPLA